MIRGENATEVTPSDTDNLQPNPSLGIYVGDSGDLTVTLKNMDDDESVTFSDLKAGVIHNMKVTRVWDTGTTATSIIALH